MNAKVQLAAGAKYAQLIMLIVAGIYSYRYTDSPAENSNTVVVHSTPTTTTTATAAAATRTIPTATATAPSPITTPILPTPPANYYYYYCSIESGAGSKKPQVQRCPTHPRAAEGATGGGSWVYVFGVWGLE